MPNTVVPKCARADGRYRAYLNVCNRICGERLGLVDQPSVPQRLWHSLFLLLSAAVLVGALSMSAEAQSCITSTTISDAVINNG